jgi:hypothetical protein
VSGLGPDAIAKGVHDTLDAAFKAIPADKHNAVIFDATAENGGGVNGMYVHRTDNGWNIVLEGGVDKTHGVEGKAVIAKTW